MIKIREPVAWSLEGYSCHKLVGSVQALALNDFNTSAATGHSFSDCTGVTLVHTFLNHKFIANFSEILNWLMGLDQDFDHFNVLSFKELL